MGETGDIQPIIVELFRRSTAGVFAQMQNSTVTVDWKQNAPWPINLGLAVKLEQASARNIVQAGQAGETEARKRSRSYPSPDRGALELETTDTLIAALYRHKSQWVLGLHRPRKQPTKEITHWSGYCWNGTGTTCMGLAGFVAKRIQEQVFKATQVHLGTAVYPIRQAQWLGELMMQTLTKPKSQHIQAVGLARQIEDALGIEHSGGTGNEDLSDFVNID